MFSTGWSPPRSARQRERAARAEDLQAIRLSLSAEVADAYFNAIEQRRQLALLEKQIEADRDLLELTELRFEAGLTASVDVLQQSSVLAETESLVPPAEALLRVSENRLDVLIGQAPDALDRVDDDDRFVAIGDLPFTGAPSDLLLNRPDLRAIKNELVAADAEIGQAISERLPRITLDGSFFYANGSDFTGPAGILLGSIVQPLLDWGARKAEVERNRALYIERLAQFSQAYLQAIEDVENTLYQERKQRQFLDRLERRRRFLERTVEETRDRYTNGLTDFLPVLDAIKELQRIERIIVRQERELLAFAFNSTAHWVDGLTQVNVEIRYDESTTIFQRTAMDGPGGNHRHAWGRSGRRSTGRARDCQAGSHRSLRRPCGGPWHATRQ